MPLCPWNTVVLNHGYFCFQGTVGDICRRFWLSQLRKWVLLLESSKWRPRMLLNILQYARQPPPAPTPQKRIFDLLFLSINLPRESLRY